MRLIYAVFLLGCLGLITYVSAVSWSSSPPTATVMTFLRTLKTGNVAEAETMLGDNSCRCPPKGGWGALLKYEHGHEPSLAFLIGHDFEIGRAKTMWTKDNTPSILPWEVPESTFVDVPLKFDPAVYAPYFLPLALAYGQTMSDAQFHDAVDHLKRDDWKGFSLRLRPSLEPGTVPSPEPVRAVAGEQEAGTPASEAAAEPAAAAGKPGAEKTAEELASELLGQQALYLVPKDAGAVQSASGQKLSVEEIEAQLPRLRACTLRLRAERRGQFRPWRVAKLKFLDAVVQTGKQPPVTLLTPDDPDLKKILPSVPQL